MSMRHFPFHAWDRFRSNLKTCQEIIRQMLLIMLLNKKSIISGRKFRTLCKTRRAACICGPGRSAALQILGIALAIPAVCARRAHPDPQRTLSARVLQSVLYSSRSNGTKSINISFFPRSTGDYRYRIENVGRSAINNWYMDGRMPLFSIPGKP